MYVLLLLVYSSTLFEKNLMWITKNYFSQAVRQSVHNLCQFISKRFVGAQNCKLRWCNSLLRLKLKLKSLWEWVNWWGWVSGNLGSSCVHEFFLPQELLLRIRIKDNLYQIEMIWLLKESFESWENINSQVLSSSCALKLLSKALLCCHL